jgi:branched-chain amino acid transport system ATP-binding protein
VTQILELVKQLATEANIAVLLVEQNAVTALRVASTAVVLNLGQVVMSGSAADIASHEELRHAYLGY